MHIVAFDAAGNKTESEKVRFYVIHKPEEKDEDKKDESGAIWLPEPERVAERRGEPGPLSSRAAALGRAPSARWWL